MERTVKRMVKIERKGGQINYNSHGIDLCLKSKNRLNIIEQTAMTKATFSR